MPIRDLRLAGVFATSALENNDMKSFCSRSWKALGGVALIALAGAVTLCTSTRGCFLSAATRQESAQPARAAVEQAVKPAAVQSPARVPTQRRVEHAGQADFEQKVLRSAVPVLVDFYADWCGPCRAIAPVLEDLARETPHARIVKVNVDEHPELANEYRIEAIPQLLLFKDGEVVAQHAGVASKAVLRELLGR